MVGCGTQLTYTTKIATGGAREMTLRVQFDESVDQQTRDSTYAFLQKVQAERAAMGRDVELSKPRDDTYLLTESFASATDYYIAIGYTGNETNDEPMDGTAMGYFVEYHSDLRLVDNATLAGYALRYVDVADQTMLFDWRAALTSLAGQPSQLSTVAAELTAQTDDRLVGATVAAMAVNPKLADYALQWLADRGYDANDLRVDYVYDHVFDTVYAKQYDEIYRTEDGSTAYVWHLNAADLATTTVTIYQKAPRVWVWELTAVAVGLAAALAVWVAILVKRRKSNAPTTEQAGQEENQS